MNNTNSSRRARRSDIHRPSAIEPERYSYRGSYSLAGTEGGWPMPAVGLEHALAVMAEVKNAGGNLYGHVGSCGVCGANFRHGDIWQHENGDLVHFGHDCAEKYECIADRRLWERELGEVRERSAREHEAAMKVERYTMLVDQLERGGFTGIGAALDVDHYIIRDIKDRAQTYYKISPKQAELVLKIAHDVANPRPADAHVPAPKSDKRISFVGEIVSVKFVESDFGAQVKCTIKVTTDAGSWLAWGTLPANIASAHAAENDGNADLRPLRGRMVDITAKLKPGRDAHFAIMNRPSGVLLPKESK